MTKPVIICLSKDDDTEGFQWMSGGWNDLKRQHTPKAQDLMAKARRCVEQGETVPDTIRRLKEAGFRVVRR
jgi:hypothetical protein